jgi:uncharacterized protein YeaO (DUF488 family)
MIKLKRAYEPVEKTDGVRILVDRLWPRGVSKIRAHLNAWYKDIAPSTSLRQWFAHDPDKWMGFKKKYLKELHEGKEVLDYIKELEKRYKTVTLVYAAKDQEHNNAQVLAQVLKK